MGQIEWAMWANEQALAAGLRQAEREEQRSWVEVACGHGAKTLLPEHPPTPHPEPGTPPKFPSLNAEGPAGSISPALSRIRGPGAVSQVGGFVSRVWGGAVSLLGVGGPQAGTPPAASLCPHSHADGWDRGRGGAVQGLVLRGVRHRGRRLGLPARVPQEQAAKRLHHGEAWPEVPDGGGEGVWAPHEELLHPSHPARRSGCPCWFPPLHHPGHRVPGHCEWHLPAGGGAWGGVETHRAEAPGAAARGGHHQTTPQQPPAPAPRRCPQETAGGGRGASEPHPRRD